MQKFPKVYHPVHLWEEISHNMWGEVEDKGGALGKAIEFTGDHILYGKHMMRVIKEWPYSCENALTDNSINKKAWIGHAACALAMLCPEDIVRKAWGYLTDEQRLLANGQAIAAIGHWQSDYAKSKGLRGDVEQALLF